MNDSTAKLFEIPKSAPTTEPGAETTEPSIPPVAEVKGRVRKTPYGQAVPAYSLEAAIDLIEKVVKSAGDSGTLETLAMKAGNTAASSTFVNRLAALRRYGLVTTTGHSYTVTSIGNRIALPTSPEDRAGAIFEAFLKNDMLRKIWERYRSKILPQADYFPNQLGELGIPVELRGPWAAYFRAAARFAGLLHEREGGGTVVQSKPDAVPVAEDNDGVERPDPEELIRQPEIIVPAAQPSEVRRSSGGGTSGGSTIDTSEPLDDVIRRLYKGNVQVKGLSGNRSAYILYPDNLSKEDIGALKKIFVAIGTMIDAFGPSPIPTDEKSETDPE